MTTETTISFDQLEKINRNLYKFNGRYYRLFATSVTPNGCWLTNPEMRELADISIATGKDVYGDGRLEFDGICGTVSSSHEWITAKMTRWPYD